MTAHILSTITKNGVLRSIFSIFPMPLHDKIYSLLVDDAGSEKNKQSELLIKSLTLILTAFLGLIATLLVIDVIGHVGKADWLGTFGDFFGGVLNPLLTFGTFIGLSITIILQRVQLNDARAEYKKNQDSSRAQSFETSFFSLVNIHNSIVEGLRFDPKILVPRPHQKDTVHRSRAMEGREVFQGILIAMNQGHERKLTPMEVYEEIQNRHNYILGHYFRNLYQIIRLIDRHKKIESSIDINFYRSVIRAQLSSNELLLIFFNCSNKLVDSGKFIELIINYEFLEHLPIIPAAKNNKLVVPMFGEIDQNIFHQYLKTKSENGITQVLSTGAFGKNKAVTDFLTATGLYNAPPLSN